MGERPGWRQQFFLSNEQKQRFVACSLYKKSESLNLESFLQDSSKTTYIILYPESLLLQVTSLGVLKRRLTLRPTRCSWHKQVMGFSGRDPLFVWWSWLALFANCRELELWHKGYDIKGAMQGYFLKSEVLSHPILQLLFRMSILLSIHPSIHLSNLIQSDPI